MMSSTYPLQEMTKNCTSDYLNKSDSCLSGEDTFDCFPSGMSNEYHISIAIWCIITSAVGVIGNLLTIFSLSYALNKKM